MIEKKILNHNYILDPQIVIDHDFTEFLVIYFYQLLDLWNRLRLDNSKGFAFFINSN